MPSFAMYSGYETVDASAGRNLFYWLVTAANAPDTAPLVLWLTGGPGCSSLYALATEHGFASPNPQDPSELVPNPYSWNRVANMLYLEAPAGVGYSFVENGDYTTGDDQVAADNHAFLAAFIASYPEYAGRPFFIAGESYAGHYCPQLASLLVSSPIPGLNFTGFSVGNPSFDAFYDSQNYWPHMAYHGLLSNAQYAQAVAACNGTFAGTLAPACSSLLASFRPQLVGVNPYSIYSPCNGPPSLDGGCLTTAATLAAAAEDDARDRVHGHVPRHRATSLSQTVVPCMNVSAPVAYFGQQAVREALHVDPRAHVWDVCSVYVNYTQYATTVRPIYAALHDRLHIVSERRGRGGAGTPACCTRAARAASRWDMGRDAGCHVTQRLSSHTLAFSWIAC